MTQNTMPQNKLLYSRKVLLGFQFSLLLYYLIAYIVPLNFRELLRPDEFRYAEIPREMIERGDYTAPYMFDMRYFEKPALGYQLNAWSMELFGHNGFGVRFPSALSAGIAALLLFFLVKIGLKGMWQRENRVAPEDRDMIAGWIGSLASGMFLTCGLVFGIGVFAVFDSQLNAALTLALFGFVVAYFGNSKWWTVLLGLLIMGVGIGLAFLLKGFLALAVPGMVIGGFLLWQKEWRKILLWPWLPLLVAALVALPWSLAVHRAEPGFWNYFFWVEHYNRFFSSTFDRKPQPFYYFIPVLLGGILPAGTLLPAIIAGWKGHYRDYIFKGMFWKFMLCWAILPFIFFSISSCKLGTYILPCFAAYATLMALGLALYWQRYPVDCGRIWRWIMTSWGWLLTGAAFLFVIYMLIIYRMGWWTYSLFLEGEFLNWFPVTLALLAAGGVFLVMRHRSLVLQLCCWFLMLGVVMCLGQNAVPYKLVYKKAQLRHLEPWVKMVPEDAKIFVDRGSMHSVAWALKRSDVIIVGGPGEMTYAEKTYPEYDDRFWSYAELSERAPSLPKGKSVIIFTGDHDEIRNIPKNVDWEVLAYEPEMLFVRF